MDCEKFLLLQLRPAGALLQREVKKKPRLLSYKMFSAHRRLAAYNVLIL
jgi:hypothetical protein